MNFKIFIGICTTISTILIVIPQNIIGCGDSIDPYDYYLSFFNQYTASQIQYEPFFYTNQQFLFDYEEPVSTEQVLIAEWVAFTKNTVTEKDAQAFVMKFSAKDISKLYYHIEKKKPETIPDSIGKNSMSQFFIKGKDLEALGYILYAKKVEPYVVSSNDWDLEARDSIAMDKLMKNGLQLYNAAKTDLIKLKYAYQIIRLAHYSNQYENTVKYYDELVAANPSKSVLQPMSLALKAGALFRMKRFKESAYLFSKAFHQNPTKRISNYYGFDWAVVKAENKQDYLALCKTEEEKADMIALFALKDPEPCLNLLKDLYKLKPSSNMLSTLIVREINKYEEKYLTPLIGKEYQSEILGISYYYQYNNEETDSILSHSKPELTDFISFANLIAQESKVKDVALMQLAAGYGAYMERNFAKANEYLEKAKVQTLSPKEQDQWMLTNLLVQVSSQQKIDPAFEEKILPSLEWLYKKAVANKRSAQEYDGPLYGNEETPQWAKFYRNLVVDILSKRYKSQGDMNKAILSLGSAETVDVAFYNSAVGYLRSAFNGRQAEDLYNFLANKKFTPFEAFLVKHNKIKNKEVADFAGTAYLRDYNFGKAIEWLQKVPNQNKVIAKNPFVDILFDREDRLSGDKITTTKLAFAKQMQQLHTLANADKANAAKYLYKLALGYYNITYYGYAWELVEYYRSGSDGYFIPLNATAFQKEYYGAYTAMNYFEKAMTVSNNKEFQARCLFMIARCNQKQLPKPQYSQFGYNNYEYYEKKTDEYYIDFMSNQYYPRLSKEYGNTKFYKEAVTRCSYLRDFVAKKTK